MFGSTDTSRHIVISHDINEHVAQEVISRIMEINQEDTGLIHSLKDYNPPPIQMYINSPGGSVSDGFAIIGAMEMSDTPIITFGVGQVASMALAIFVSGDIRVASRFTRFMYHSISYGMMGHITEHEEFREEADLLQKMYDSLMHEETKLGKEKIAEIRKNKFNFFFGAVKGKKLGFVDEIIEKPEKRIEIYQEDVSEDKVAKENT